MREVSHKSNVEISTYIKTKNVIKKWSKNKKGERLNIGRWEADAAIKNKFEVLVT